MSYRLKLELQGKTIDDMIRALDQTRKLLKKGYLASINSDGPSGYCYTVTKLEFSAPTLDEHTPPNSDRQDPQTAS